MAFKDRFDGGGTLAASGDHLNTEVIHNDAPVDVWEAHSLTIVDLSLTVITDTDDVCGVRLLCPVSELLLSGDLTENNPKPEDPMVWYSWYAARGPLVFRVRTKRTIGPEFSLWVQTWKAQGATSTIIRWGMNYLIQPHN